MQTEKEIVIKNGIDVTKCCCEEIYKEKRIKEMTDRELLEAIYRKLK